MTPDHKNELKKCQDTLLEKHRDYYFAALFSDQSQRPTLMASFAMLEQIRNIPHNCSEPNIARTKLAWWSEEIKRLEQGEARHPTTLPLQRLRIPIDLYQRYLDGVMRDLEYDAYPSQTELTDLAQRIGGTAASITAHLLQLDKAQIHAAEQAGTALLLTELFLNIPEHAHKGRVYFPLDILKNDDISPEALQHKQSSNALKTRFKNQSKYLKKQLEVAVLHLPKQLNHLRILSRFQDRRFTQLKKNDYDLLVGPVELTPLHQLWAAWRCAQSI